MTGRTMTLVTAAALMAACTGGVPSERTAEGLLLEAPPDAAGVQLTVHAPPGLTDADRRCHLVVMPGGDGTDVEAIEHRLSDGAREVRLSHTDLDLDAAWERAGLVLCDEIANHAGPVAYSSDEAAGGATLPSGVALHFGPHEVVLLEARFDDAAGAAGDEVAVNLWYSTVAPDTRTAVLPTSGTASGSHDE